MSGLTEAKQGYQVTSENWKDEEPGSPTGTLLVVTGFTAAGKSSIVEEFLQRHPEYKRVITTTTRAPRQNETLNDYNFASQEEFDTMRERGDLLEETEVIADDGTRKCYGTPKSALEGLFRGEKLVWVVDMKRVANIEEVFRHYKEPQSSLLRAMTIPVLISTSRLTILKDRYFKRESGQSATEKKVSFIKRLRMDWDICKDPVSVFPHTISSDGTIAEATAAIESLLLSLSSDSV